MKTKQRKEGVEMVVFEILRETSSSFDGFLRQAKRAVNRLYRECYGVEYSIGVNDEVWSMRNKIDSELTNWQYLKANGTLTYTEGSKTDGYLLNIDFEFEGRIYIELVQY